MVIYFTTPSINTSKLCNFSAVTLVKEFNHSPTILLRIATQFRLAPYYMKHFEEQLDYYKHFNPKIDIINRMFNNKFNVEKNHSSIPSQIPGGKCHICQFCRNYKFNNTFDKFKNYPSLHKMYINEYNKESIVFIEYYKNHKEYFHNNVFEELMSVVWHPKNIDKFYYLEGNELLH